MRDNEVWFVIKSLNQVFIQKSSLCRERSEEREEGRREGEVGSKFQRLIKGMKTEVWGFGQVRFSSGGNSF